MNHTPSETICNDIGIEEFELAQWVTEGNWLQRRSRITDEAVAQADAQLRNRVIAERMPVVEAQLDVAKKAVKRVDELIGGEGDDAPDAQQLAKSMQSFKIAAETQSNILGLQDAAKEATGGGKPRLVMNVYGAPAKRPPADPVAAATPIDVEVHGVDESF